MKSISPPIRFEIGKCYRHVGSRIDMYILGELETTLYGRTLVAERSDSCDLMCVGSDYTSAQNWMEIPYSEWMKNFS